MSHLRYRALIVALAMSGAVPALAQTREVTSRDETPTFQSSVNLVRVPVVVRDKTGHPVGGLHKEDFHLTDHGKPQDIAQFAVEGGAVAKPASEQVKVELPGDSTAKVKPPAATRFVAFVVDDVNLTSEQLGGVRTAALKYIEQGMPPEERVALITLSGNTSLEMTNDAAKFREALMKIQPVPPRRHFPPATFYMASLFMRDSGDEAAGCKYTQNGPVCDPSMPEVLKIQTLITRDCLKMNPEQVADAPPIARTSLRETYQDGQADANRTLRILDNSVRLLGALPGDRVMILISPGILLTDDQQRVLGSLIDRATHSGVVINSLDSRGVYTNVMSGKIEGCVLATVYTAQEVARMDQFANAERGLILGTLPASTGGAAVSDNNFLGGLNRLARPPEYVYYLGYYPQDLKADGKFHDIKVTLANPQGVTLQARKGYWAPAHVEDAATTATREIAEAVFSHDELHDLPLDVDTEYYKTPAGDAKLKITSHLDIHQLHLRKVEDRNRNDVTLVCALFDGNGNYVQGVQKVVELRLKDENVEHHRGQGLTVNSVFDVKRGAYMVRVVARDGEGRQMAAANDTVEIP